MINFIHIPKTAGTSFRLAAEQVFGPRRIAYDYHAKAVETSDAVRRHIYTGVADVWALGTTCHEAGTFMIGGHFRANKYAPLCGINNSITFLRDPVQRLVSEWRHFVRHNGYKDSFQAFYNLPHMQNRMTKLMAGAPLEALGFVGLTERYNDCLTMLDQRLCVQIPRRVDNVGDTGTGYEVSDEDLPLVQALNQEDFRLFDQAARLLEQRLESFRRGEPWVHGRVTVARPRKIAGWAWYDSGDKPVEVTLKINGSVVAATEAAVFSAGLARWTPPRGGFVGFEFAGRYNPGDMLECFVSKTGQALGGAQVVRQPES